MPYDVVEANRLATQTGLALGQAMFNNSLRMQELKSRQAYQQLQEQELAQRLQFQMEAHDQMVQQRADMTKANAKFELMNTPAIPVATGTGSTLMIPNPTYNKDAGANYIAAFSGLAKTPQELNQIVTTGGMLQYRQAQATRQEALANQPPKPLTPIGKLQAERKAAIERGASQQELDEINTSIQRLGAAKGYAPTDTMKNLQALHDAEASGDDNAIAALRKQLKLDGLTRMDELKLRSELRALDNNIFLDDAAKDKKRESIFQKYGLIERQTNQPTAPADDNETVIVIDPQGRKGTILRKNLQKALKQGYKEFEG